VRIIPRLQAHGQVLSLAAVPRAIKKSKTGGPLPLKRTTGSFSFAKKLYGVFELPLLRNAPQRRFKKKGGGEEKEKKYLILKASPTYPEKPKGPF
jgi:hypothetical protein